jgi:hypothetical protein
MSDIDDKSYLLGVNLERERNIALLETLHRREPNGPHNPKLCAACRGIALIKWEPRKSENPDNDAASENPDKGEQS